MNQLNVVFIGMIHGDDYLFVNGSLVMYSGDDDSSYGIYVTAVKMAKAVGVKLVEFNNTPVPDFDYWTPYDVLNSLPDLSFTCGECGRIYDDSTICMSDVSEKRRNKIVKFLMKSYLISKEEAEECAERGNYTYTKSGKLAAAKCVIF